MTSCWERRESIASGSKDRRVSLVRGVSCGGYARCCKPCTSRLRNFSVISRRRFLKTAGMALAGSSASFRSGSTVNPVRYVDVARSAGISFQHDNAASSEKYLIETMGSGCGWIDYDQNGLLDLYLVNGVSRRPNTSKHALRSALYRNNGNGTFTDVTDRAGVGNLRKWGSSAAWFDYDNDGLLDLVIANYVDWSPEQNFWCGDKGPGLRSYCHPDVYRGQPPTLYHNNGDGTFSDVSKRSGVGIRPGNGLGVVTFDYDNDGWQDIFITNDQMPNFLFHNNRDGTFREIGYSAGVAVGIDGQFEAGMGTDAADTTGSGRADLIVTHLDQQLARLYQNVGEGYFEDATFRSKISYATFHLSGFGTRFMDYDNDGARDLFMANGHVLDNIQRYHAETTYAEPKLMFRNTGHGIFQNVSEQLGSDFQLPRVSRGAAIADFDNDGDLDILVSNNGQPPQLLRNDGGNSNHWLQIFLIGTRSNRDAVGARVKVAAGDLLLFDQRKGGMSYQSAQDPRLHFGLGRRRTVEEVEIKWPSGELTKLTNIKADQIISVKEGEGIVERPFPRVRWK